MISVSPTLSPRELFQVARELADIAAIAGYLESLEAHGDLCGARQ